MQDHEIIVTLLYLWYSFEDKFESFSDILVSYEIYNLWNIATLNSTCISLILYNIKFRNLDMKNYAYRYIHHCKIFP